LAARDATGPRNPEQRDFVAFVHGEFADGREVLAAQLDSGRTTIMSGPAIARNDRRRGG
jgi:hypothetical protein